MEIKIKKLHPDAFPLEYKTLGAAGFDFTAVEEAFIPAGGIALVKTGWAIEVNPGYELTVRPRSGISLKESQMAVLGTVDSDYRGEVGIILMNASNQDRYINIGTRVAQGVISPVTQATFHVVEKLSDTSRGEGGFGSTGK